MKHRTTLPSLALSLSLLLAACAGTPDDGGGAPGDAEPVVEAPGVVSPEVVAPDAPEPLPRPIVWRDEETGEEFVGTLASARVGVDALGFPALHAELVEAQQAAFHTWTGERIGHQVSLIVDDHVLTSPVVQDALPGKMVVRGGAPDGFGTEEVEAWVAYLNDEGNPPR